MCLCVRACACVRAFFLVRASACECECGVCDACVRVACVRACVLRACVRDVDRWIDRFKVDGNVVTRRRHKTPIKYHSKCHIAIPDGHHTGCAYERKYGTGSRGNTHTDGEKVTEEHEVQDPVSLFRIRGHHPDDSTD